MEVHILNGDALKARFPSSIEGECMVAREAMIDGDTKGTTLESFFNNRARFYKKAYGISENEYAAKTVSEFAKLNAMPSGVVVNAWFEDDLFCQTNLWFIADILMRYTPVRSVFLVRPDDDLRYGFGGMDTSGLEKVYRERTLLETDTLMILQQLWKQYQHNEYAKMSQAAHELNDKMPWVKEAVEAHRERQPTKDFPGRPKNTLMAIMNELQTQEFKPIFKEFTKRESIYGFGDLQVKRMLDEVIEGL